jgi:cell division septation protein DedD
VVSVVIFLCGVLVGRGVRAERNITEVASLNEAPVPDILPSSPTAPPAIQAGTDPRDAAPPAPVDEKSGAVSEDVLPDSAKAGATAAAKPAAEEKPAAAGKSTPAEKSATAGKAAPSASKRDRTEKPAKPEKVDKAERAPEKAAPTPKPFPEPVAATSVKEPSAAAAPVPVPTTGTPGDGYAVQVAAVNGRTDADAIAKRFSSKGYAAYVEQPPHGTGTVYRVRIGTFKTKREAETIAAKLQKEEQIKPWVTR